MKERPVLDVESVAELERRIATAGTSLAVLMARAGVAVADAAEGLAKKGAEHAEASQALTGTASAGAAERAAAAVRHDAGFSVMKEALLPARFVVLCGSGNNGGDGWVAAQLLAQRGYAVDVLTQRAPAEIKAQPAHDAALRAEGALRECEGAQVLLAPTDAQVAEALDAADVVVDAILGTGFSGDTVRAPYDGWIRAVNAARRSGARIVAADVPSGLSAQMGSAADPCIHADLTVTMIVRKRGLAVPEAVRYCGNVSLAPLVSLDEALLEGLE
ncbi:MAG: NAD(P)H-hydrate epimerase [Eggerthellaceae bacterium]|nr:NAD(P)H-hydrate epimerase [Eggerthellaceae bacterium]